MAIRYVRLIILGVGCLVSAAHGGELSWNCDEHGVLRSITNKVVKEESVSYCWKVSADQGGAVRSQRCFTGKCAALEPYAMSRHLYTRYHPTHGTRSFHLCLMAHGVPGFYEVKTGQGWLRTTLCRFEKDKSFVSIGIWETESLRLN